MSNGSYSLTLQCGDRYESCSDALLLPIFEECTWPKELRAFFYLAGLFYCFMGVAIIADVFMGAIEKITSKTRKLYLTTEKDDEPEVIEVRIWSDTVANLTLMALGSSAPEILLSIIEIVGNNFNAGELGPGTIVGSAAFNLFVISAICVVFIPTGEIRAMKDMKVFTVTAVFSVSAYVWLLIILVWSSKNVVEIWEAALTLAFFPLMVLIAWLMEKNVCFKGNKTEDNKQIELGSVQPGERDKLMKERKFFPDGRLDRDGLVCFIKEVKKYPGLTDEDAAVLAASKLVECKPHSRMWYRVGAVRNISGGRKIMPQMSVKLKEAFQKINSLPSVLKKPRETKSSRLDGEFRSMLTSVYSAMNDHPEAPTLGDVPNVEPTDNAVVSFRTGSCAVMENVGKFSVEICRSGRTDNEVKVRVETIDGSAVSGEDYLKLNEVITFESGVTSKEVVVEIVNDNQWEPDEEFFLKISLLYDEGMRDDVQLGRLSIMEVTILNDDQPGSVVFQKRGFLVKESVGNAVITVIRKNGADGEISVKWRTIDKSALSGKDYIGGEGVLTFKHSETTQEILIPIVDDMKPEKDEHFEVELFEPTGGSKIGQINRTAVTIISDDNFDSVLSRLMYLTNANVHAMEIHHDTYSTQIKDALNVNGGDIENATFSDYVMHFFTFGWKVLFALVPPPSLLGGWLCFIVSLSCIGLLTAIIGDLASLFGCLVGLPDSITAITLVALGTSLPDTFASRAAAVQEKYADNAVGNITGSNSVNVFLGLGLPWLVAAIYHASNGNEFRVEAGSLGFNVGVFTGLSVVFIVTLVSRRFLNCSGKAVLGGPTATKIASGIFFVFLWLLYLLLSILKEFAYI